MLYEVITDDLYYNPKKDKKTVTESSQTSETPREKSDYERYRESLENEAGGSTAADSQVKNAEYADDQEYLDEESNKRTYSDEDESYDEDYEQRIRRSSLRCSNCDYSDVALYDPYPSWSFGFSLGGPYFGWGLSYGYPYYRPYSPYHYYGYYRPYYYYDYYSPWGYWDGYYDGYYSHPYSYHSYNVYHGHRTSRSSNTYYSTHRGSVYSPATTRSSAVRITSYNVCYTKLLRRALDDAVEEKDKQLLNLRESLGGSQRLTEFRQSYFSNSLEEILLSKRDALKT